MCQGYSAVLLPQLLDTSTDDADDTLVIDSEQASWIGKCYLIIGTYI